MRKNFVMKCILFTREKMLQIINVEKDYVIQMIFRKLGFISGGIVDLSRMLP